jgi:signal transduction histidine kinase
MSYWMELERQKIINQQQKTRAFASAAHEFRNPLNSSNIALDMLGPYITDPNGR